LWRGLPLPISGDDGKTIGDRHRVVIVAAPTNCHVWLSASRRHHERETHPREAEHDNERRCSALRRHFRGGVPRSLPMRRTEAIFAGYAARAEQRTLWVREEPLHSIAPWLKR
jgi:hypothetical protein